MEARPVLKNQIVFVTRCINEQRFRLAPSPERNEIIEYLFAVISQRHDIGIIALTVMSNHYHGIFFDPHGSMPRFTAELHANLARVLNWADRNGRGGRLWDGKQTNQLNLNSNEIVLEKIAYVMANPVAAGAVAHGKSWPGVRVSWPSPAKVVSRPRFFQECESEPVARPKGHRRRKPTRDAVRAARETWATDNVRFPEYALLETVRPPGFDDYGESALKARIRAIVRDKEARVREERLASGKLGFLGARACRDVELDATPSERHPLFSSTPTIVGKDRESRDAERRARKEWLASYKAALRRWSDGDKSAVFPAGTYFMFLRCGVYVDPAPPN